MSALISMPLIPSRPRFTSPDSISCCDRILAILLGIAKPMPTLPPPGARIAVLIPINSPLRFSSAPPEFPRLMEASVWIKFSRPSRFRPLRPNAEIIPEVAVWPRPKGLPTATAKSPTRNLSESAITICVSLLGFWICSSAISL
ncbi:hypothetical protein D3C80_1322120 [compost metagenome]